MSDDLPFLRAIANAPADDAPRLIYADWLEEHDDPRAAYVRLEVELHRLADSDFKRKAALMSQVMEPIPRLDAAWVERMQSTRRLPPGARLDLAVVSDGKGLIDVRGGDGDTVLLVEGRPIALNWDDCQGSVGQYLVFTGHTRGKDYAEQLRDFVAAGPDAGQPLAEPLGPLLSTFANGTYWLGYNPSSAMSLAVLGYPTRSIPDRGLVEYYPADDWNLTCTQPIESLDQGRVAFFRAEIRNGLRPVVLTVMAEGAWCEFVIDGHHKLEAYQREQVKPAVVSIIRWDAPAIGLDEGIGYLPRGHAGVTAYRRMKGRA